jgi:hypothetical protein
MRINLMLVTPIVGILSYGMLCLGQSPLPSADLSAITARIQRDFGSIDQIHTVSMSDDPGGRFDVIVVGTRRGAWSGWRVEALSIDHHRLGVKWDSAASAKEPEFESSGSQVVEFREKEYDYDILIQGCVAHNCGDGIDGFLVFSGSTGKTYKAKVVTEGLDKPPTGAPKYDVTFSADISSSAKKTLQDEMCRSSALSNKSGLPFECKGP